MCNFEIEVLMGLESGDASKICATKSGCIPLSMTETFPCDAFGRYVKIRRTSDVANVGFQLCEVEVFAKRECNGMDSGTNTLFINNTHARTHERTRTRKVLCQGEIDVMRHTYLV